jgi:hypothetical protein
MPEELSQSILEQKIANLKVLYKESEDERIQNMAAILDFPNYVREIALATIFHTTYPFRLELPEAEVLDPSLIIRTYEVTEQQFALLLNSAIAGGVNLGEYTRAELIETFTDVNRSLHEGIMGTIRLMFYTTFKDLEESIP